MADEDVCSDSFGCPGPTSFAFKVRCCLCRYFTRLIAYCERMADSLRLRDNFHVRWDLRSLTKDYRIPGHERPFWGKAVCDLECRECLYLPKFVFEVPKECIFMFFEFGLENGNDFPPGSLEGFSACLAATWAFSRFGSPDSVRMWFVTSSASYSRQSPSDPSEPIVSINPHS